jgi:hypothetical protein
MGSASGAHSESTQWAKALSPLATDISTGRLRSSEASYTTARGNTTGSTPVVFRPASVSPQTGVASLPAYVVGTAMIGSPVIIATALASPVVDPPPTETTASTSCATAAVRARAATSTGTCITTSS